MPFFAGAHDFLINQASFVDQQVRNTEYRNSFNATGNNNTILGTVSGPQDSSRAVHASQCMFSGSPGGPQSGNLSNTVVPPDSASTTLNHEQCHKLLIEAHRQLHRLLYGGGSNLLPGLPQPSAITSSSNPLVVTSNATDTPVSMTPRVVLHRITSTRSHAILWLLEELEIPFIVEPREPSSEDQAQKHPLGPPPKITETSTGDVLEESGLIIQHLIAEFGDGRFVPSADNLLSDQYFVHFCQGTFEPTLTNKLRLNSFKANRSNMSRFSKNFSPPAMRDLENLFGVSEVGTYVKFLEKAIKSTGEWFAGGSQPTAADFVLSHSLEVLYHHDPDLVGPNLREWIRRIQSRPAYKRAVEENGDYPYLLGH